MEQEKKETVRILPVEDADLLKRLNQMYGTKARFGLLYVEKREIKSTCLYQLQKPHGQILNISSQDPVVFGALANAAIEEMKAAGMTDVRFAPEVADELLHTLALPAEIKPRTYPIL